jgi:hypothetical protein
MTARFITAPDKLPVADPEEVHTKILIVDSDWHDIEAIAILCMTRQVKYDFYLFGPTSIDLKWLDRAIEEADTILVNNASPRFPDIKDKLKKLSKTKSIGTNADALKAPMDFIVKQLEEE